MTTEDIYMKRQFYIILALFFVVWSSARSAGAQSLPADGRLRLSDLRTLDTAQIAKIDVTSSQPRNILMFAFQGDWALAKEVLVSGHWPIYSRQVPLADPESGKQLMRKLVEFRKRNYLAVLETVRRDMGLTEKDLWWNAAGSTTLTSDIDVSLEGHNTEEFVERFNRYFSADAAYRLESGTVYDVNVYAEDFLFATVGHTLPGGQRILIARDEYPIGGHDVEQDAANQNDWSRVHMRLYMTGEEWQNYVAAVSRNSSEDEERRLNTADRQFRSFMQDMEQQMYRQAEIQFQNSSLASPGAFSRSPSSLLQQTANELTGHELWAENLLIAASNRVYERKLKPVAEIRDKLHRMSTNVGAETTSAAVSAMTVELRDRLSEATLFSNEAYVTDGAVNHAVMGLQMGKAIHQTRSESIHAFNENVGDVLKEIGRHRNYGEAVLKASKYIWRAGDAAMNTNVKTIQGIRELRLMQRMGNRIANGIRKDNNLSQHEKQTAALQEFSRNFPDISHPAALRKLILRVATDVAIAWSRVPASTRAEYGEVVSAQLSF